MKTATILLIIFYPLIFAYLVDRLTKKRYQYYFYNAIFYKANTTGERVKSHSTCGTFGCKGGNFDLDEVKVELLIDARKSGYDVDRIELISLNKL